MTVGQFLVVKSGPLTGKREEIKTGKPITIGGSRRNTWTLSRPDLQNAQIQVVLRKAQPWVEGLFQQVEVFVNDERLEQERALNVGDKLVFYGSSFAVEYGRVQRGGTVQKFIGALKDLPTHKNGWIRYPAAVVESTFLTSLALLLVTLMGVGQTGFYAIFLAAASLTGRFQALLQENKHRIFVERANSFNANITTSLSILMIFLGICLAFFIGTFSFSETDLSEYFGFAFDRSQLVRDTLLTRNFGAFGPILGHNFIVLGTVGVMCLLYRSYAALLTLGWNACLWVIVLVSLTRPLIGDDFGQSVFVSMWAILAVGPHLVMEGAAYVIVALAAIFYSKGATRYFLPFAPKDPTSRASILAEEQPQQELFLVITLACLKLLGVGLVVLLIATVLESYYATWMLSLLEQWLS